MSTCFLHVPDPDDQPFDDDEPNKPIAPGDRWCSLWAPREPGGPRLLCHPSIEGTADEWLLIAGAIEAGAPRAFGRVAFAPAAGGGELWSPHNSTGDRDHVRLTTAELVELAADVRAKLATPDRDLKPDNAAPAHPLAEDGRRAAGYDHVFHEGTIDMTHIGLEVEASPVPSPHDDPFNPAGSTAMAPMTDAEAYLGRAIRALYLELPAAIADEIKRAARAVLLEARTARASAVSIAEVVSAINRRIEPSQWTADIEAAVEFGLREYADRPLAGRPVPPAPIPLPVPTLTEAEAVARWPGR